MTHPLTAKVAHTIACFGQVLKVDEGAVGATGRS